MKKIIKSLLPCFVALTCVMAKTPEEVLENKIKSKINETQNNLLAKAEKGDTQEQLNAFILAFTVGSVKDFKELYVALLEKKVEVAISQATLYYYTTRNKDFKEIIDITKAKFEQTSDRMIGQYLACMLAISGSIDEAITLFEKVKDLDSVSSEIFAFPLLEQKDKKYRDIAISLLENAIEKKSPTAAAKLGLFFFQNDKEKGIKYLEKSAQQGDIESSQLLCLIFAADAHHKNKEKAIHYANIGYRDNDDAEVSTVEFLESGDIGQRLSINYVGGSFKLVGVSYNP